MNKLNASVLPLVGLSVVLSMSAIVAVAAHWPNTSNAATSNVALVRHTTPVQTVRVVMHDPGCHWFQTANGMKRTLHVNGSLVRLVNMDEAALKVAGPSGMKLAKVGSAVRLAQGNYKITMVGQKSDDNTLKLVVS